MLSYPDEPALGKDGSMYSKSAFPVINLAETGRSIERCRRQAGLTVRDLQTYFGFEYPQAIYKWQHGECLPTVDNLLALARLLRVNMEDLLVWNDPGDPPFLGVPRENTGGTERNILPVPLFYRELFVMAGSPDTARRRRSAPCWHRDPPGPS